MTNIFSVFKKLIETKKNFGWIEALKIIGQSKIQSSKYIKYSYKNNILYSNKDNSAIYHLNYSIQKVEKLVDSIPNDNVNVVFDVGANNGLFGFFIKKRFPDCKLYMFEPTPALKEVINLNMQEFDNWELIDKAVYCEDYQNLEFFVNLDSQQTNSTKIASVEPFAGKDKLKVLKVQTLTLDKFIQDEAINKIDVLKVDIQGGEPDLIKGATNALMITDTLLMEMSFLDYENKDFSMVGMLNSIEQRFPKRKVINPVFMGADIRFSK